MTKIGKLFHKVGNWHNKISVLAGLTKAELKKKFKDTAVPEEIEKVIAQLSRVEKQAVGASKVLDCLKVLVDKKIGSDINKTKRRKSR